MYEKFYHLKEKPFKIIPNPNALFLSSRYENALTYLEYGLTEKTGFILLTGEIGMGKTTLVRYFLNKLGPHVDAGVIFNTNVNADQILKMILLEFDLAPSDRDKSEDLDVLYQYLIERYREGKQVVLIIDEAQNLTREALEEVRMLSNLQTDEEALIQIMIVGQPELNRKLEQPGLAQFSQRIAVRYHLSPLSREECHEYIAHRLRAAGGNPDVFLPDAMNLIYETARGIPRTINLLCDASLVYGYADEINTIGEYVVQQVIDDNEGVGITPGTWPEEAAAVPNRKDGADLKFIPLTENGLEQEAGSRLYAEGELLEKIVSIESAVQELRNALGEDQKLMQSKMASEQKKLMQKVVKLLVAERKQYVRLARAYGRLQEKYHLLKEKGKPFQG